MTAWKTLREFLESHVLPEERMYRGETNIRMKDLETLFSAIKAGDKETGKPYTADPQILSGQPNPQGGVAEADFPVDPRVWGRWSRNPSTAAVFSATKDDQYPGAPRGGTVMKRAYGGRVFYQPGKPSTGHEKMASTMDRYDVMMLGDVTGGAIPTQGLTSSQGLGAAQITVRKIAWSPAIGSTEERQERLKALLMGGSVNPLRRRPQGQIPEPSKKDAEKAAGSRPEDVPRQGAGGRLGMGNFPRQKKKRDSED